MTISTNLLPMSTNCRPGNIRPTTLAVVMHWVGNPLSTPQQNRDYWASLNGDIYGSAHYIVGTNGQALRAIPDDEVAYHVGTSQPDPASGKVYTDWARSHFGAFAENWETASPNFCSIGIEMCHLDWDGTLTEQTLASAAEIAAHLLLKYGLDPYKGLTTHNQIVGWKDCPRWFVNHPDDFDSFKKRVAASMGK